MTELLLRDIHLPDPISWWPLAYGWWLAFALIFLLITLASMTVRKYLKPTLRKEAKRGLALIEKTFLETDDASRCVSELSGFLRRLVLSRKPLLKSAGLTGQAWLELLDQSLKEPEFSQGAGQILLAGPYRPRVEKEDATQLIHLCRKWVNNL